MKVGEGPFQQETRTQTQREDRGRTQGEDGHLQAKERGLRRHRPYKHLDLGLPTSRTGRSQISVI